VGYISLPRPAHAALGCGTCGRPRVPLEGPFFAARGVSDGALELQDLLPGIELLLLRDSHFWHLGGSRCGVWPGLNLFGGCL
jgi:hypothetical protein